MSALAARAPVPVFAAVGMHGEALVERLALHPALELVDSPRHAAVLLVAGGVPPDQTEALRRLHDQLPPPCTSLWFRSAPPPELADAERVDEEGALVPALQRAWHQLLGGERPREPHLLPDRPPHPWEGQGMHGQGGEGMMGGTPYGRPMAMAMMPDLRDGLQLDTLKFTLGPFFPLLPPGLVLQVALQGDLIQHAMAVSKPWPVAIAPVFFQSLEGPVPVADLEVERARHHLRRLARAVRLAGLEALASRLLRQAQTLAPGDRLSGLRRQLTRARFLHAQPAGLGRLDEEQAHMAGGPALRAAGLAEDARCDDPAYRQLGFAPVTQAEGDCRARWQQWLAEIEQSLALAARAAQAGTRTGNHEAVESPRGRMTSSRRPMDASMLLMHLLPGLEWGEALATVASLDLAGVSPWAEDQP